VGVGFKARPTPAYRDFAQETVGSADHSELHPVFPFSLARGEGNWYQQRAELKGGYSPPPSRASAARRANAVNGSNPHITSRMLMEDLGKLWSYNQMPSQSCAPARIHHSQSLGTFLGNRPSPVTRTQSLALISTCVGHLGDSSACKVGILESSTRKNSCLHPAAGQRTSLWNKNKEQVSWVPVTHTCNPSYLGGRDQEDGSSKPTEANSWGDPILKISSTKQDWWSGSSGRAPA
jgi:hypothetical protein